MKKLLHGWSLILTLGLLAGMSSCSKDDAAAPATVNVGKNTLSFEAFATEAQTITVEANYDWTFTVTGDTQICEVTREEGSNTLTVTPKINYDNVAHTAQIVISAGEGSNAATQTITVSQAANGNTYLYILNTELSGDNPVAMIQNNADGSNTEYEIRLSTNNKLTVAYSGDQGAATTSLSLDKTATRVAIEGCDWITYEVSEEQTTDGTVTVLTLSCTPNKDLENSREAYLDLVSGEGTQNEVVKKHIGVMQLANKPTIMVNATEENKLIASYDQSGPLSFTVAANVAFNYSWVSSKPAWITSFKEVVDKDEEGQYVRTYTIEVAPWMGLEDRQARLQFLDITSEEDGASADAIILQTAAPKASLSLNMNSVTFNNGEESSTKYVNVTTSFSTLNITTVDGQTQEAATWLDASYDPVLGLALKVKGTSATTRSATVTLTCGGDGNEASATLTVKQLGTEPSLELDPATIQLDEKGTAVVVNVNTNQSSWEVLEPSAEEAFTLTLDKEKNTITVSATALTAGSRSHTYTVKAGSVEKELTVSQSKAYKVGDPFVVNGKTVGIVYQVDEQGMHGKAFSLTVHNIQNKETNSDGSFAADNIPLSRTDGKANRDNFMAVSGWESKCEVTKWTADLAAKDGVDWYVPAIDELIELSEYMTGLKFTVTPYEYKGLQTEFAGIPFKISLTNPQDATDVKVFTEQANIDTATKNWKAIRNLYTTYTTDQYIVFLSTIWNEAGEEEMVDSKFPTDSYDKANAGDLMANVWLSSTVELMYGSMQVVKTVDFSDTSVRESYKSQMRDNGWWDEYGGSIHPICQF